MTTPPNAPLDAPLNMRALKAALKAHDRGADAQATIQAYCNALPADPVLEEAEEALAKIEAMGTVEMSVPVLDEAGNRDEKETTVRLSPEAKIARAALKSIQEARSGK